MSALFKRDSGWGTSSGITEKLDKNINSGTDDGLLLMAHMPCHIVPRCGH